LDNELAVKRERLMKKKNGLSLGMTEMLQVVGHGHEGGGE
jgi:hypothetical protein